MLESRGEIRKAQMRAPNAYAAFKGSCNNHCHVRFIMNLSARLLERLEWYLQYLCPCLNCFTPCQCPGAITPWAALQKESRSTPCLAPPSRGRDPWLQKGGMSCINICMKEEAVLALLLCLTSEEECLRECSQQP